MGFSLTGNADTVIATFQAKKQIMPSKINRANQKIIKRTQEKLLELYPPKLAAKWTETSWAGLDLTGLLGKVQVETTAKEVYGYEFGTPPHEIVGRNSPRRVLAFAWGVTNGMAFFRRVHHPGTAGMDRRQSLQAALSFYALDEWATALREAIVQTS